MIRSCQCESPYQDKRYGKGNRVHTEGGNYDKCTVCGKEKQTTREKFSKEKPKKDKE